MYGNKQMTELQLRKRALLLESDLNRLMLHGACNRLGHVGSRAGPLKGLQGHIGPWALRLAPLAGMTLVLGLRRRSRWFSSLSQVIAFFTPFIRYWRAQKARSSGHQP